MRYRTKQCSFSPHEEGSGINDRDGCLSAQARRRLRDALVCDSRKELSAIVINEILERADVGRSAF
jgi:hypothetical protein